MFFQKSDFFKKSDLEKNMDFFMSWKNMIFWKILKSFEKSWFLFFQKYVLKDFEKSWKSWPAGAHLEEILIPSEKSQKIEKSWKISIWKKATRKKNKKKLTKSRSKQSFLALLQGFRLFWGSRLWNDLQCMLGPVDFILFFIFRFWLF